MHGASERRDVIPARIHAQAAVAPVERREAVGAKPIHGYAERLEHFDGARQIEHRLRAGADDRDRPARERGEIRGHVAAFVRAAMHAADAAGREHFDA